jgi:Spy/CpxP family protein refolding chaperone
MSTVSRSHAAAWVAGLVVLASAVCWAQQRNPPRPSQGAPRDAQRREQPPQRFKWWQDEKMKAELRLTPEQTARIEEIFQGFVAQMKGTAEEVTRREEQLSRLISGNDVTEAQLLKEVDQLEALRGALMKSRTLMLFRIRRVLSPDQRARLVEIQRAQDQGHRGGRSPDSDDHR